ncbi:hypothetical protein HYH02_000687 [Chlamydomonas schloesseri]|uniref:Guanylate cyclase domain-containing protein n=1 Tax=Chlamydomonas schloesseri TaxID=2026947 RepID=A0A835WWB2_9CHLO|nr:hypothetical protein HYH02_000687 [Chlamydomonas schloesseri]|eukprot:KAG2454856.1 hypothetical protein HYH02_000687 [Chlamydomonas schloesseri]
MHLVKNVRTRSAETTGPKPAFAELVKSHGGAVPFLDELRAQSERVSDPIALVTFERTSRRAMRTQRASPNLLCDINLEALFASGIVPPPAPPLLPRDRTASAVEFLESPAAPSSVAAGAPSAQGLLHLIQSTYCKFEALRMSVRHGNGALLSLLGCSSAADYEALLGEMLGAESTLRAVLHECCLALLEGVAVPTSQLLLHHPLRGSSGRVVLPVTVQPIVVWRRLGEEPGGAGAAGAAGMPQPSNPSGLNSFGMGAGGLRSGMRGAAAAAAAALLPCRPADCVPVLAVAISYNLSAGLAATLQQLHRVYAMLGGLSGIVTLFTIRGRVLHQNTASIRYMGLRQGAVDPSSSGEARGSTRPDAATDSSGLSVGSVLRQVFVLSPEQLDDLLDDVAEGKTWKGIVRVPPLLSPTVDPGPGAHLLLPGGSSLPPSTVRGGGTHTSFMFSPNQSQAQAALTPWEKLQTGMLSTQTHDLLGGGGDLLGGGGGSVPGRGREATSEGSPAQGLSPAPSAAQAAVLMGTARALSQHQLSRLQSRGQQPPPSGPPLSAVATSAGGGAMSSDPDYSGLGSNVIFVSRYTAMTEGQATGDEGSMNTLHRGLLGTTGGQSTAGPGTAAGSTDPFNPRLTITSPAGAGAAGGAGGNLAHLGNETSGESSMYVAMNASTASNATSLRQDSTRGQVDFRGMASILNSHRSSSRPMQGLSEGGPPLDVPLLPPPTKPPSVPSPAVSPYTSAGVPATSASAGAAAAGGMGMGLLGRHFGGSSSRRSLMPGRAASGINMPLVTLNENASTRLPDVDLVSTQSFIDRCGPAAAAASGAATGGAERPSSAQLSAALSAGGSSGGSAAPALSLHDMAKARISRRRSALKLGPASRDDDPLSTSTWGLMDGGRRQSKSFTTRRAGGCQRAGAGELPSAANAMACQSFTAIGSATTHTDALGPVSMQRARAPSAALLGTSPIFSPEILVSAPTMGAGASSGSATAVAMVATGAAGSGGMVHLLGNQQGVHTSGGSASINSGKGKRPPSRLMSFLANKNLSGVGPSGRSFSTANNVRSMPIMASGGATNSLVAAAMAALAGSGSDAAAADGDASGGAVAGSGGADAGSGGGVRRGKTASTTEVEVGAAAKARASLAAQMQAESEAEAESQASLTARGCAGSCGAPIVAAAADVAAAAAAAAASGRALHPPAPPGPLAGLAAASGLPYNGKGNDTRSISSATPHYSRESGTAAAAASAAVASLSATLNNPSSLPTPRRPPTRRVMRPAVDDVAEEAGTPDASGALPTAAAAGAGGSGGGITDSAAMAATLANLAGARGSLSQARGSGRHGGGGSRSQVPSLAALQAGALSEVRPGGVVDSDDEEEDDECWHEITASCMRDPVSGEQVMLLLQVDVTARVRAERRIQEVLEAEHKLLESVFPRHVLEMAAANVQQPRGGGRGGGGGGGGGGRAFNKYSLAEMPLAQNAAAVATYHPQVTILFSDIIGFTSMCHEIPATKVMQFLNELYSRLDTLLDVYGVYKVETIGDCYMVAGGLMTRDADGFMTVRGSDSVDELHAHKVMSFAKAMLRETAQVLLPTTGQPVQMRIGLHSGPVMSGIVGSKMPRFCLFGDTVNTASRMESTCPPGAIHVSEATRNVLQDEEWEATGGVMVKGKGAMQTYRWVPPDLEASPITGAMLPAAGRAARVRARARRASSMASMGAAVAAASAAAAAGLMSPLAELGSGQGSGNSSRALAGLQQQDDGGAGSGQTPSCSALAHAVIGSTAGTNALDSGADHAVAAGGDGVGGFARGSAGSFARGSSGMYVHSLGASGGRRTSALAWTAQQQLQQQQQQQQQQQLGVAPVPSSGHGRNPGPSVASPAGSQQSRSRLLVLQQQGAEVAAAGAGVGGGGGARSGGAMPVAKPSKRKPHRSCSTTALAYAGRPPPVV